MKKWWSTTKKAWFAKNPPDYDDNHYVCWLCKKPVHVSKVTLDHVLTREMYPEYEHELSNLRPAHKFCNEERAFSTINKFNNIRKRRHGLKRK